MADVPVFSPNPFANFDPTQWSNPYSKFAGKALPFPSSYMGWPTDAMGNPIQPQPGSGINPPGTAQAAPPAPAAAPGTTLNSMPSGGGVTPSTPYGQPGTNPLATELASGASPQEMAGLIAQMSPTIPGTNQPNPNYAAMIGRTVAGANAPAAAPPAPAAGPGGLTAQQYLSLLANPGKVTTPGATVAQSAPPQSGSNVLQQFLAGFQPAQSGPGSGFQQSFAKALKGS